MTRRLTSIALALFARLKFYAAGVARRGEQLRARAARKRGGALIETHHAPTQFARRYGDFTANVCGRLSDTVRHARYRLNDEPWREIKHAEPRVPTGCFTLEFGAAQLLDGANHVLIEAVADDRSRAQESLRFHYDPKPPALPLRVDWQDARLDVQDGQWERIRTDGEWRVRPAPASERYDRILVAAGAFADARQIETEVIFRHARADRLFGFGVLPLWGGRPDSRGGSPRGGWNFGLVWYYSNYAAVGLEFSYKDGDAEPAWVASYRNLEVERDARYRIVVRCAALRDAAGEHRGFVLRMKWWKHAQTEPQDWMEIRDTEGAPIPRGRIRRRADRALLSGRVRAGGGQGVAAIVHAAIGFMIRARPGAQRSRREVRDRIIARVRCAETRAFG